MKRNRKKQSNSKLKNRGVPGIQVHDMATEDGMQLLVPFYMLNGKMWIPSTPWEAGEYEGTEWAKTASATSLRNAAERLTTNEQIEQHVGWCKQCENNGQPYVGTMIVRHPAEFESDAEVRRFYRNLAMESSCYQGNDPDIRIGKCTVTGVPGHNLRQFEDGWAAAVRKCWNKVKMAEQPLKRGAGSATPAANPIKPVGRGLSRLLPNKCPEFHLTKVSRGEPGMIGPLPQTPPTPAPLRLFQEWPQYCGGAFRHPLSDILLRDCGSL